VVKLPRRPPVRGAAPPGPSLAETYPDWFQLGAVALAPGWGDLVERLFADLAARLSVDDRARLQVAALRERDGRLSIELYEEVPAARALIDDAVAAAATLCQHCGAPGKRRRFTGWAATLCPPCRRQLGAMRIGC
jgi:hypothetical protein